MHHRSRNLEGRNGVFEDKSRQMRFPGDLYTTIACPTILRHPETGRKDPVRGRAWTGTMK
ncbi:protein of unknown function [Methanoculleus bourgensis]|uniref:Uncharacterized protein n=1 Tax=Methanoculleus bourgensis TaxID=83986 RepID=A0A0X3BJ47_9EURY|nr:protein of unknown function [Methanoculleus bourgensis]